MKKGTVSRLTISRNDKTEQLTHNKTTKEAEFEEVKAEATQQYVESQKVSGTHSYLASTRLSEHQKQQYWPIRFSNRRKF